jgi:hypothetical protein
MLMKKVFAIIICALFVASFAVVGCKKEEPKPADAPKVEAPAAQPAPAATPAPEPAKK